MVSYIDSFEVGSPCNRPHVLPRLGNDTCDFVHVARQRPSALLEKCAGAGSSQMRAFALPARIVLEPLVPHPGEVVVPAVDTLAEDLHLAGWGEVAASAWRAVGPRAPQCQPERAARATAGVAPCTLCRASVSFADYGGALR